MKHIYALLIGGFALLCSVSHAQPTLTASGVNPVLGDNLTLYNGSYLSPGGSGANQTWNFTALAGSPGDNYDFVAPSSTTWGNFFPNANLAGDAGSTGVRYFNVSSASLENHGTYVSNIVAPLDDPEDYLRFPCAFGNSYTDTWSGQYTSGGYLYYRSGTTTVTADAYGTMTTPAGTFSNVMRVHFVQNYQDSTNIFGSAFVTTSVNDQYMWYQNGFHMFLASTYSLTSGASTFSGASYASQGAVGMGDETGGSVSMELYPIPASERLTVEIELAQGREVEVEILNGVGQRVQDIAGFPCKVGTNLLQLDVNDFPAGIYFAKVMVDGKAATTKRFMVAH